MLAEKHQAEICGGPATPDSVRLLAENQYRTRRLNLVSLFDRISEPDHKKAVEILLEVDEARPEVIRDVLMHPPAGVWLVRALRSETEFGYLHSLAAAAAIRAAVPFEIDVPVDGGFAYLPTLGVAPFRGDTATVTAPPAELVPSVRHRAEAGGIGLDLLIEDGDPYREFADPLSRRPLGADEVARWRDLLDEAWQILMRRHTAYAHELSAGLTTLVPITAGRKVAGASSRAAFGGLILSAKDSPAELADVLVHELQHSKLNAVLDMVPLVHRDSGPVWYAPWRFDPRPLAGVLHGIYAFTSVAEFWGVEREHVTGAGKRDEADFAFALRRSQVREAIENVRTTDELTDLGRRLVDAADTRIQSCERMAVPAEIEHAVTRKTDADRAEWHRAQAL